MIYVYVCMKMDGWKASLSFWDGPFSGAFAVSFGRVYIYIYIDTDICICINTYTTYKYIYGYPPLKPTSESPIKEMKKSAFIALAK